MGPSRGKGRKGLVAEINVTPLVDVMLVLLIIFMVTAPMMTQGIDINLPKTTSKALRQEEDPFVVRIGAQGDVYLGTRKQDMDLLSMRLELEKMPPEKKKEPIYLQADERVPYGAVARVMAEIKQAGFEKLGMVTLPDEKDEGQAENRQ